jgi:hypothetical protein
MERSTTTVTIDREVAKRAKIAAAELGVTLQWLVETSMLAWLTRWPKGTVPKKEKEPLSSS